MEVIRMGAGKWVFRPFKGRSLSAWKASVDSGAAALLPHERCLVHVRRDTPVGDSFQVLLV